jgi:hypothetical protein
MSRYGGKSDAIGAGHAISKGVQTKLTCGTTRQYSDVYFVNGRILTRCSGRKSAHPEHRSPNQQGSLKLPHCLPPEKVEDNWKI